MAPRSGRKMRAGLKWMAFDICIFVEHDGEGARDFEWLLDAHCPFDFTALDDIECMACLTPSIVRILERSRLTIKRLKIDARIHNHPGSHLTHLIIATDGHALEDASTLLASLSTESPLGHLTNELRAPRRLTVSALRRLISTSMQFPALGCVALKFACSVMDVDVEYGGRMVRTALMQLGDVGRVEFVVY
ncbi:hypothetical protein C8R43DRAFT_1134155 [Mycena crocata]|nr:hypothetical protein C8R43DRAFT_1134155 [Mycena crocata]